MRSLDRPSTRHPFENLLFHVKANDTLQYRLFFSLKKKYFNAVERNLVKRRIKEYFRTSVAQRGFDLTVVALRAFNPRERGLYMDEVRRLIERLP